MASDSNRHLNINMPRRYKRKEGARRYRDYTPEMLDLAVKECVELSKSCIDVAQLYKIPIRTLRNKIKGAHFKKPGGQTVFSEREEQALVINLLKCADYGMPLDTSDVKLFVQTFLRRENRVVKKFSNNVPGNDWVSSFIGRHEMLTMRMCQNIKLARSRVSPEDIKLYFDRLRVSIDGVLPQNILNYDETNLSDNPGVKKYVFRRGVKYPERVLNHSKGNISIMFAGTATGELLPPYVIYKAENLWSTWCEGGPPGTQYRRSKNGWMNSSNFDEWFMKIVVPWARRNVGKKIMIGDNLSSHLSAYVLEQCAKLDIRFVLLAPNSTDKCQPLDVAFFGPQKREWRKLVEEHRGKYPSISTVDKARFPSLLNRLISNMELKNKANLTAGFAACGIYPFDPQRVLKKLPSLSTAENEGERQTTGQSPFKISAALLDFLQQFKYSPCGNSSKPTGPRRKLAIEPGKSVTAADLNVTAVNNPSNSIEKEITPGLNNTQEQGKDQFGTPASIVEEHPSVVDGCFVVVKLPCIGSTKTKYYVAKVIKAGQKDNGLLNHELQFMRKSIKVPGKFIFPDVEDNSEVEDAFIFKVLPPPISQERQTKRQSQFLAFPSDLSYCE